MTFSELRARHTDVAEQIARWGALHTLASYELEKHGCTRIAELPAEIRNPMEAAAEALRSEGTLRAELEELGREAESALVVQELRRMYFLPDTRTEL